MGVQISRSICPEEEEEAIIRSGKKIFGKSVSRIGGTERLKNHKREHGAGSCAHVDIDTAEVLSIRGYWIYKVEKCNSNSEAIWEQEEEFQWRTILGERICSVDSWI